MAASIPLKLQPFVTAISETLCYQSDELSYFALKSAIKAFLAPHVQIRSPMGYLTIASFDLALGETAGGKQKLGEAYSHIVRQFNEVYLKGIGQYKNRDYINLIKPDLTAITPTLPASLQGLHFQLLESNALAYVQDEFGGFLRKVLSDPSRQEMLSFLTQLYTSGFSEVAPPKSITNPHTEPVENPRVSLWGMTQTGNFIDNLSLDLAEKGFYGRFDVGVLDATVKNYHLRSYARFCEMTEPKKVYEGVVGMLKETEIVNIDFSPEALQAWEDIDRAEAEPLKQKDNQFAGRLMEHAMKDSAFFAIIDGRTTITGADLEQAFEERLERYKAFKEEMNKTLALSEMHPTTKALLTVKKFLAKNKHQEFNELVSIVRANCRLYRNLSVKDQEIVIKQLCVDGLLCGRMVEHVPSPSTLCITVV